MNTLLDVIDLKTYFYNQALHKFIRVVDGVSLRIREGETMAMLGESGSGKTRTAYSVMGLVPHSPGIIKGEIWFGEKNLLEGLEEICKVANDGNNGLVVEKDSLRWEKEFGYERRMQEIRGRSISLVLQGARSALNPYQTIGEQIEEAYLVKNKDQGKMARVVNTLLGSLGLIDKKEEYPHRLSGGSCQRALLAVALAQDPTLLILDEPTVGLDPPLRVKMCELLEDYKEGRLTEGSNRSLFLITHDMDLIISLADTFTVLYAGRMVESGPIQLVLEERTFHPYTRNLMSVIKLRLDRSGSLSFIPGQVPYLFESLPGCRFHPRCSSVSKRCRQEEPELVQIEPDHWVRCFKCRS